MQTRLSRFRGRGAIAAIVAGLWLGASGCGYLASWPPRQDARRSVSEFLTAPAERTLWADGWLRLERGGESVFFGAELLVQYPDKLRLTAFGLFDRPEAYLASNGESLALYFPQQGALYRGVPAGLAPLLGLPDISLPELVGLLSGRVPVSPEAVGTAEFTLDRWRSQWLVRFGMLALEQRLRLDRSLTRVEAWERTTSGARLDVTFSDFRSPAKADRRVPHRVEIRAPDTDTYLRARYREIESDAPVSGPDVFELRAPAGSAVRPLSDAFLMIDFPHDDERK